MTLSISTHFKFNSSEIKEGEHYIFAPFYKLEGSDEYCWLKNNTSAAYPESYYVVRVKDGVVFFVRGDQYSSDSFKEVSTHNEIPGQLAENVSYGELEGATLWSISGNLNGTDIKHIVAHKPSSLTYLNLSACNIVEGGDAYYKEKNIEYFTEDNVVGSEMFRWMGKLSTVKLPLSTKTIRKNAIHNDYYLCSIIIPDACEVVEDSAIYNCGNLTSIHLGKNVREFGAANGIDCYDLLCFSVDKDNTSYKEEEGILYSYDGKVLLRCPAAYNKNQSNTFAMPTEVAKIADYAFYGFRAATSYELNDEIHEIGKYAFGHSQIFSLTLPQNVQEISEGLCQDASSLYYAYLPKSIKAIHPKAFLGCKYLKEIDSEICNIEDVVVLDDNENSDAFSGISATCHWRVPSGSAEVYKVQKWWVDTWTIEEEVPESIVKTLTDSLIVEGVRGGIRLEAGNPCNVNIYDLQGKVIRRVALPHNFSQFIPLENGIYLVNGQKIIVN